MTSVSSHRSPCASWAPPVRGFVREVPLAFPAPHHHDPNQMLVNFAFLVVVVVCVKKVMNKVIVRDVGHFDNAIDLACLDCLEGIKVDCIKTQSIFSSSLLITA